MKIEIKLLNQLNPVTLINGTFDQYGTGWLVSGQTYDSDDVMPPLIPSTGTTVYEKVELPVGWKVNKGFLQSIEGSDKPLQQTLKGELGKDQYYKVEYTVIGYEKPPPSEPIPEWDGGFYEPQGYNYYYVGDIVKYQGNYYRCIKFPYNQQTPGNTQYWTQIDLNEIDETTITPYLGGIKGKPVSDNGTQVDIIYIPSGVTSNEFKIVPSELFNGGIKDITITPVNTTSETIDLYDEESFNLTFQIQTALSNKSSTFSKTIKIPGTSKNNTMFGNILNIGRVIDVEQLDSSIFLNKKLFAGIYSDSVELLVGYLEIQNVIKNNNATIEYDCVFYSNLRSFADVVGDKLCQGNDSNETNGFSSPDNIDFSEYDHKHTWVSITDGWSSNMPSYSQSKGVYYPLVDFSNILNGNKYRMENFKPSIYAKELWDKIFEKAGFTYTSNFLNSETFKSLVILESNDLVETGLYQDDTKFNVGRSTDWLGSPQYGYGQGGKQSDTFNFQRIPLDNSTTGSLFNNNNTWNSVLYQWKSTDVGTYDLHAGIRFTVRQLVGGSITLVESVAIPFVLRMKRIRGQREDVLASNAVFVDIPKGTYQTPCDYINSASGLLTVDASKVTILENDIIYLEMMMDVTNTNFGNALYLKIYGTTETGVDPKLSQFSNEPSKLNYYLENQKVFVNDAVPRKMKQIDFIKSISNKFNLMFTEDRLNMNNLIIEPYDDFYLTGSTVNWSNKLDLSQDSKFERIKQLINKDVKFSFTQDSVDILHKRYTDNTSSIFGNKLVKNMYYTDDTENIEDKFTSTMLGQLGATNWVVSKIFSQQPYYDTGLPTEGDYNYRLLYRNYIDNVKSGVILSTVYVTSVDMAYTGSTTGATIRVVGSMTNIPYAGIVNNPYSPKLDLNYGTSSYYLPNTALPTQNNLYWKYWAKKISLYSDVNSKLLTSKFNLTYTDIALLDFRKQIYIDSHLYRLQKIIDWSPSGPCKVELLQVNPLNINAYLIGGGGVGQEIKIPPGGDITDSVEKPGSGGNVIILKDDDKIIVLDNDLVTKDIPFTTDPNTFTVDHNQKDTTNYYPKDGKGIIIGSGNVIKETNFFVKGDNNVIVDKDTTLFDSNNNKIETGGGAFLVKSDGNIISSGVTNVVMINTTGLTITEDNKTYINGRDSETFVDVSYVISTTGATLQASKDYTDAVGAGTSGTTIQAAKDYTNSVSGSTLLLSKDYTNSVSGLTLLASKDYTNSVSGSTLLASKDYTNSVSGSTLLLAKNYTNSVSGSTLLASKDYTNSVSGSTLISANDYADNNFRKINVNIPWNELSSKPTTVSGYGIVDVYTTGNTYSKSQVDGNFRSSETNILWTELSNKPTTVSGYGITDVFTKTETQYEICNGTCPGKGGTIDRYSKTGKLYSSGIEYIIGDKYNGAGRTITLSTGYCNNGKQYLIQDEYGNASTNNITIDTEGTELINGANSIVINTNYGRRIIYSDGSNWFSN